MTAGTVVDTAGFSYRDASLAAGLGACFLLLPVYLGPSGGIQVVDIAMLATGGLLVMTNLLAVPRSLRHLLTALALFSVWMVCVDLVQFARTGSKTHIVGVMQRAMPLVAFAIYSAAFHWQMRDRRRGDWLYLCLAFSVVASLVFPSNAPDTYVHRRSLSFNNPNQLAYFSTLMLVALVALDVRRCILCPPPNNRGMFARVTGRLIVVVGANVAALLSLSRSGIPSCIALDALLLWLWLRGGNARSLMLFAATATLAAGLYFASNPDSLARITDTDHIAAMLRRFDHEKIAEDSGRRVHDRISEHIQARGVATLLTGTGKITATSVKDDGEQIQELHSVLFDVTFSGGVIGLVLLLNLARCVIRLPMPLRPRSTYLATLLLWIPIVGYNLLHNGLRFRALWVVMALWCVVVSTSIETCGGRQRVRERSP